MSMSPLPGEGAAAADPVKLCDASGMATIHRYFRAGFAEGPALVRSVSAGDADRVALVATELSTLSSGLHAHHEGEEMRLWDALEERAPGCALHVGRMRTQHQRIAESLEELNAVLPAWRASGSTQDADAVLEALDGVNAALTAHFGDEEQNIVPVMETVITPKEIQWFSDHGRKATPKGQSWNVLGAIMAAQPDDGKAFLGEMPAPFRLVWRLFGRSRYDAHRAALTGRG